MIFNVFSVAKTGLPCGRPLFPPVAMLAFSLGLCACSNPELPGQVVVKVNGMVITDHQLGGELARNGGGGAREDVDRSRTLQELIDRKLLQSEALRKGLHRDPHIVAALEDAHAQILAQAYLQSRVAYAEAPSTSDVRRYFDSHPEQFAKRTLYHLRAIQLSSSDLSGDLKTVMDQARSLDDVAAWLDGRRIMYSQARQIHNSADMPAAVLDRMREMKIGQLFVIREGKSASLLALVDIQDSPLGFTAAAPQIERILLERRGRELGQMELARLRADAKVVYADDGLSPFANTRSAAALAGSAQIAGASGRY